MTIALHNTQQIIRLLDGIPYLIEQPVRMSTPNVTEVRRMELLQAPFADGLMMVSQVLRSLLRKIASLTTKSRKIQQHVYLAWETAPLQEWGQSTTREMDNRGENRGWGRKNIYICSQYSTNWPVHNIFRPVSALQENTVKVAQYSFSGSSSRERFWIKSFQCQEILLKVK